MLSAKRLRQHAGLFGALLGVVALVSGLSVGIIGFLAQSADDGVRSGLSVRTGAELALRVSMALDGDAAKQDAEIRAAIDRSMQHLPFAVDRTIGARVDVARITEAGVEPSRRAAVLSIPDLPDRATLVDGTWPTSADEVSVQADGALRLDVVPGDRLRVGDADVTVTGLWRVNDRLDPRWLGEAVLTDGVPDVDVTQIVVDESLWPQLETDPRARWTLVPDARQLTAADLVTITGAWNQIGTEWRGHVPGDFVTLERTGAFTRTALDLGTRVNALHAIEPVVLLLLAAITLVTLAELARLLTTTRSVEIALLWSRGASALDIGRTTAAEAAVAAVVGSVIGTGGAVLALTLLLGPDAARVAGTAVWTVPAIVTIAGVLVVAGSAFRSARRQTVRDPSEAGGRARRLAGPGVVILVTAAAVLSVWQLWLYGSPLTPTSGGGTDVDPIAVVAPALILISVVLLALVVFPRVAALDEFTTRRAGVARVLAARTVARRLQLVAAPIVVVAVACSTIVFAAGYETTWSNSFQRTSELRAGSAVHASPGYPGLSDEQIGAIGALPNIDGIAPIDLENLQLGGESGSIVAVTPSALRDLATTASGSFDPEAVAEAITAKMPGPVLGIDTTFLAMTASVGGFSEPPTVSMKLLDSYGVLHDLVLDQREDLGMVPDTVGLELNRVRYSADLPPALVSSPGPWRILAVDISISQIAVVGTGTGLFGMEGLTARAGGADVQLELDKYWVPESPGLAFDPPNSNFNGLGFAVGANSRAVRLTPTFDEAMTDRTTPPVVVSQRLADQYGLKVGDIVSFFLEDAFDRSNCSIVAIVPAIPGARLETAVMIDLGVVMHARVRRQDLPELPREFWIDTSEPEAVATALRPLLPANARVQTAEDPAGRAVLGSAAIALWLGALGCLLLAIVTVVAVVRAQLRSRRLDVMVLRAIGLSSRDQAAVRRRELVLVLGFGVFAGVIGGTLVTLLTVPQLARAAVVDPYLNVPTPLGVDLVGLTVGLAVVGLILIVIVGFYTSRVAVQARSAAGSEEEL